MGANLFISSCSGTRGLWLHRSFSKRWLNFFPHHYPSHRHFLLFQGEWLGVTWRLTTSTTSFSFALSALRFEVVEVPEGLHYSRSIPWQLLKSGWILYLPGLCFRWCKSTSVLSYFVLGVYAVEVSHHPLFGLSLKNFFHKKFIKNFKFKIAGLPQVLVAQEYSSFSHALMPTVV